MMNQEQLNNFANNFVVKPKEEQYDVFTPFYLLVQGFEKSKEKVKINK